MDWNKTKTIFIIVFSILNVFLYSLYLNRYTESENVAILGDATIEENLTAGNIMYSDLPDIESESYVLGKTKTFTAEDVPAENIQVTVTDGKLINVFFNEPVALPDMEGAEALEEFVSDNVYEGDHYILWEVDEERRQAIFFQEINGKTLYYSDSGELTVHWNEEEQVTHYEQTAFEEIAPQELMKGLISPTQAIHTLYQRTVLQPNTEIDSVTLGYSAHVQISEGTQMFLPTWRVKATPEDGSTEDYFVNAFKDGILELEEEDEEEAEVQSEENQAQEQEDEEQ